MARLVVVSNRVGAPTDDSAACVGGLAMALSAALGGPGVGDAAATA